MSALIVHCSSCTAQPTLENTELCIRAADPMRYSFICPACDAYNVKFVSDRIARMMLAVDVPLDIAPDEWVAITKGHA